MASGQNGTDMDGLRPVAFAAPRRPASVRLRTGSQAEDDAALMDPANQSLADALKLVFKGLQLAMLALAVAFVFSGLGSVKQNQKGIKLLFGKPVGDELESGFHFSFPYPMGELVRIDGGNVALEISDSFWPRLTPEQSKLSIEQLAGQGKPSLKPGDDGSLLTADSNIVHTQWTVHYTRAKPGDYIRHVFTDDERNIVKAAVERGIVRAVSGVKIDDLLKQSASDQASVAVRAQEVAQETLDELRSGIKLDKLTLLQKVPPFAVYSKFSSVQSAEQTASQRRDQALTEARNTLNAMAGVAHDAIIEQIDLYEQAVNKGDQPAQEKALAVIDDLLLGREVAIGDKVIPARLVSGEVTRIINEAKQYSSSIAEQRRGELAAFRAKLAQFRANPDLVIYREWADAMGQFLDKPIVEAFRVPAGTDMLELFIGRDPAFLKEADRARKDALIKAEDERRRQEADQARYQTRTDIKALPAQ